MWFSISAHSAEKQTELFGISRKETCNLFTLAFKFFTGCEMSAPVFDFCLVCGQQHILCLSVGIWQPKPANRNLPVK